MKRRWSVWLVVALLATVGCTNMSARQQRALSGEAIGAAVGAAGATTGYFWDRIFGALTQDAPTRHPMFTCWAYSRDIGCELSTAAAR